MRLRVQLTTLLCASVLLSAVAARAAVPIRTPAAALVAVAADRCAAPDAAVFAAAVGPTSAVGWTLAGASGRRWTVAVDAERAAALGLPTAALREWLVARAGAPEPAAEPGTPAQGGAEWLLAGALPAPKGAKGGAVPLNTIATVERGTGQPVHLLLDGRPVVAAATVEAAGPGATVAAAAALATACGAPLDAVTVAFPAPSEARWCVAYRTPIAEDAVRLSRAQMLEGAIAPHRGAGLTLGVHRPEGGAVWGFARGAADPALPPAAGMKTPGLRAIVLRAYKGHWQRPLQSVVRFAGPADQAALVFETARRVAAAAGPTVNVLLTAPQAPLALVTKKDGKALDRAKLTPDDVAFALAGLDLRAPNGDAIHVALSPGTPRADVRLVGGDGRVHPLATLGTLEERPPQTATVEEDTATVYLGVPIEGALPVAKALAADPPPEPVKATIHNWNVVPIDIGTRLLAWWQGE